MARYDRGYDRSLRPPSGDPAAPYGSRRGMQGDRQHAGERPWVGGYREGYQGGSSGVPTGGRGFGAGAGGGPMGGYGPRYDRDLVGRPGGRQGGGRGGRYGGDYWWLGERAFPEGGRRSAYDEAYRRFDEENHPRYSPVGGNYHAMGGEYRYRRPPEPLREERWFSDWTRWF